MTEIDKAATDEKRRLRKIRRVAHARGLMQGICSMLRPGDVVIDCGANVGEVTAKLAATGAAVHAFEPDPYTFGVLTEAVGHLPNVTLHNAAVGVADGAALLMRGVNFAANPKAASVKSSLVAGGRGMEAAGAVEVPVIDFPAFLRGIGPVAFLKMDIEGAELDLLEAMEREGLFDDVRLTVAETHEKKFKDLRPRFDALRARLSEAYPVTKVNLDWI